MQHNDIQANPYPRWNGTHGRVTVITITDKSVKTHTFAPAICPLNEFLFPTLSLLATGALALWVACLSAWLSVRMRVHRVLWPRDVWRWPNKVCSMEAGRRLGLLVGTVEPDILWLKSLPSLVTYQLSKLRGVMYNGVVTGCVAEAFSWRILVSHFKNTPQIH